MDLRPLAAFRRFAAATSGAVTVDWTVLTAALVGIGFATGALISVGAQTQSGAVAGEVGGLEMNDRFREELANIQFLDGPDGFVADGPDAVAHGTGAGSDGESGFLEFVDGGGDGVVLAPAVLTGDLSGLYGGAIAFDMASFEAAGGDGPVRMRPLVSMTTTDGQVLSLHSDYAPDGGWTAAELSLRADAGWTIDGRAASEAEMRAALADVAETRLRMAHADGLERTGLDNLVVTTPGL